MAADAAHLSHLLRNERALERLCSAANERCIMNVSPTVSPVRRRRLAQRTAQTAWKKAAKVDHTERASDGTIVKQIPLSPKSQSCGRLNDRSVPMQLKPSSHWTGADSKRKQSHQCQWMGTSSIESTRRDDCFRFLGDLLEPTRRQPSAERRTCCV